MTATEVTAELNHVGTRLREYCQNRGWQIAAEFSDVGVSGAMERRPQLNELLAGCRKSRFDSVVVYRYDRFARSLRQLVNALAEFETLGIQFISLHEGVDTSTPNGRLIFGIFASIAEFERQLIRDRVRSGIAAARSRGGGSGGRAETWTWRRSPRFELRGCRGER